MSCNYADALSPYDDKGVVGLPEKFDDDQSVDEKSKLLAKWILESQHVVVHTGAGISTSAGIPDFRGPNGVWTLEKKGLKPSISLSFDEVIPTKTHMAIAKLVETGHVKYIVSQNVDGLHLRSGIQRENISELHGNIFIEQCLSCKRQFVRKTATVTMGQKSLGTTCHGSKVSRRGCRGKLHDTILDWEANLPDDDLLLADYHSSIADLSICLGTTLQIVPSGNLPLLTKKYGGLIAITNLQPTKHDKKSNLIINAYVDVVISKVMKQLGLEIPEYSRNEDPVKIQSDIPDEWSFSKQYMKEMKNKYNDYVKMYKLTKVKNKSQKRNIVKDEDSTKRIKTEVQLENLNNSEESSREQIKTEVQLENINNSEESSREQIKTEVQLENINNSEESSREQINTEIQLENLNNLEDSSREQINTEIRLENINNSEEIPKENEDLTQEIS